jgi:hypothetical protein
MDYEVGEPDTSSLPDGNLEAGPVQPGDDVRNELQAYLAADSSRVGEMYRLLEEGLAADTIAERLEGGAAGAWQYRRMVRALLDGNLPVAPTVALAAARRYRTVLKTPGLSAATRSYLQANLDELERRASDPARLDEEAQQASKQTQQAEARNEIGVYVYALPHYIRHSYDQATGRTLLKVGHSNSDVIVRFRNQTRTTALPEEPILLRIYRTSGDSAAPGDSRNGLGMTAERRSASYKRREAQFQDTANGRIRRLRVRPPSHYPYERLSAGATSSIGPTSSSIPRADRSHTSARTTVITDRALSTL